MYRDLPSESFYGLVTNPLKLVTTKRLKGKISLVLIHLRLILPKVLYSSGVFYTEVLKEEEYLLLLVFFPMESCKPLCFTVLLVKHGCHMGDAQYVCT